MSSHFRQLAGHRGYDRNYSGFQLSSMNADSPAWPSGLYEPRFVQSKRCIGGIHVPAYSAWQGGFLRWEVWGEHLDSPRSVNQLFAVLSTQLPDTLATQLIADRFWNTAGGDPTPAFGPFHLQIDMIPCETFKTIIDLRYTAGVDGEDSKRRLITATPGSREGDLDATFKEATVDFGTGLPASGDIIRIADGTKDSHESLRPFVFGGSGDYVNVGIGASAAQQGQYFVQAVQENSPKLRATEDGAGLVTLYPFFGGETPYGHELMTIEKDAAATGAFTVTDFNTVTDTTLTDWSQDQEFYLSLLFSGMHSVVYHVSCFQYAVTKGHEVPVR